MEEKKLSKNDARMSVVNKNVKPEANDKKLSYDELNTACMQLSQQNQLLKNHIERLTEQMRQLDFSFSFKRLEFLFKVLEHEAIIKDSDFILKCVAEIKEALTIPEQTPETSNKAN